MTEYGSHTLSSTEQLEDCSLSWQASEVEQKVLDSARCLWERSVQQNIRDAVSLSSDRILLSSRLILCLISGCLRKVSAQEHRLGVQ